MPEQKKYKRRPVDDIATKVTVNKTDAEILLKWSWDASASEQHAVPTREIVKRLIDNWSSSNVGKYPPRIKGSGD
jgi:hypothetical protein